MERFTTRLEDDTIQLLKLYCKEKHISQQYVVDVAIRNYIYDSKKKDKFLNPGLDNYLSIENL